MTAHPPFTHVLILEDDPAVAQAISRLALDVLSHEPHFILGTARSVQAAAELLQRLAGRPHDRVLVACAARLAGDTSGVAVLDHLDRTCPNARVILLTDGEREDLVRGLARQVDGIVQKPVAMPELRAIIEHLATDARPGGWARHAQATTPPAIRYAIDALHVAMEAVEMANDRLREGSLEAAPELRRRLVEAERLALLAHRRVLEVERGLAPPAGARAKKGPDP